MKISLRAFGPTLPAGQQWALAQFIAIRILLAVKIHLPKFSVWLRNTDIRSQLLAQQAIEFCKKGHKRFFFSSRGSLLPFKIIFVKFCRFNSQGQILNDENVAPSLDSDAWEEKPPSLMRAPKPAAMMLQSMMKEVNSARGWLREISAGQAGSNGPYFSPCHAKGGQGSGSPSFHSHPLYVELSGNSMDYNSILNSKLDSKEPAKRAIQQGAIIQKLRQVHF